MPNKKTTINDIAKAAGVSKTTVSRYLNGKFELMSPATVERIRNVIEISDYRPSPIAQSLKSRRTMQVGVIMADISSPFCNSAIFGLGKVLSKHGYIPLIVNANNDPNTEERLVQDLIERGVDGLLVIPTTYDNPTLVQADNAGTPVVLIDRYVRDHHFSVVTNQIREPIENLVTHLYKQGYATPWLFIEPWAQNTTRIRRRDAFIACLTEIYQSKNADQHVVSVDIDRMDKTAKRIREMCRTLPKDTPPAVMGGNTVTTMHLLGAVQELGLSMPNEIGVCGPDDWQWDTRFKWAELIAPGITTFAIDAQEMGKVAAEMLVRHMMDAAFPKQEIILPTNVILRGRTKNEGIWNHGLRL